MFLYIYYDKNDDTDQCSYLFVLVEHIICDLCRENGLLVRNGLANIFHKLIP